MYDRKSFQNIVTIFPPDKAENEETILFKLGLKDGAKARHGSPDSKAFCYPITASDRQRLTHNPL